MRGVFSIQDVIRRFAGGLVIVTLLTACAGDETAPAQTPKAIFIIADGIPADVLERTATPNLDEIAAQGGYTRSYVGGEPGTDTETPTVSAPGYNCLLTGTWANKHNVYDNAVENPNYQYWDIFRIAKTHDADLQTAIFSTWEDNRTKLIGDGLPDAGGHKLDYHFDGFENDTDRFPHDELATYIGDIDELISDEAARYISEVGPDLSWVYLEFTDSVAHRFGDSAELTEALAVTDDQIGKIWSAIKHRQQAYEEDWLIVVTTDHGRDAATGKDHGGQSERERTTWIVTNSDSLNDQFADSPAIVDILPSIVTHLGLDVTPAIREQLDGRSFID